MSMNPSQPGTAGRPEEPATRPPASDYTEPAERRMKDQADEARHEAQEAKESARKTAEDATRRMKESARATKDQVTQQAREQTEKLTRQAKEQGSAMLQDQKQRAAEKVEDVGAAVRRAAEKLHEEHDDTLASYADAMAGQMEACARYLRERDVNSLMHDAADMARRRPEWVLGGAFVAGLALSRFLKASRPNGGSAYGRSNLPRRYRGYEGDYRRDMERDYNRDFTQEETVRTDAVIVEEHQVGGTTAVATATPTGPLGGAGTTPATPGIASGEPSAQSTTSEPHQSLPGSSAP